MDCHEHQGVMKDILDVDMNEEQSSTHTGMQKVVATV
jgi:hypothetical protein